MSSDSVYTGTSTNLDLIDEEWSQDSLSDDEIELTPDQDLPMDEHDLDGGALGVAAQRKEDEDEKWVDLGLEIFVNNSN